MLNLILFKEVFYQSRIPQLIGNSDFSEIEFNPAYCEFTGYSIEELAEIPIEDISHPDDIGIDYQLFTELLLGKRDQYQLEKRFIHKSGEIKTGILTVSRVREEVSGKEVLLGQILDVTEKKHMEYALKQQEKLAIIGQLAAAVAHEIRNPLTPIKGFMQLLHAEKEINPVYLSIILDELRRVEGIISEFLTLARPHTEKSALVRIDCLFKQVIKRLETDGLTQNKVVLLQINPSIPAVLGDANSLKQVFINILQNGLEALSEQGRIDVLITESQSGVLVKVSDNGCGIPKDRLDKLGEPFYSTKEKGTGLGLMTCYRIIENHGGKINIDSVEGEGTTVTIWLPYSTPSD